MIYDLSKQELPPLYQSERPIGLAVIHCAATLLGQHTTVSDIDRWHRLRGFDGIGYHFYITVDGLIHTGRPLHRIGAHTKGFNAVSVGICYEGGLDACARPCDTRTILQKAALVALLIRLKSDYPQMDIVGHRDLNPHKACPCFDVGKEYDIQIVEH